MCLKPGSHTVGFNRALKKLKLKVVIYPSQKIVRELDSRNVSYLRLHFSARAYVPLVSFKLILF